MSVAPNPLRHPRPEGRGSLGVDEREATYSRRLVARLKVGIEERARAYVREDRSLDEIGSPEAVASRMLAAIPEPSRWDEVVGPVYRTGQVRALLGGVSRQAVAERRRRGTLLALETDDGVVVYPVFQFDQRGRIVEGLPEVLRILGEAADGWTVAGWLRGTHPALGGRSVIEWLGAGEDAETVRILARDTAERWSR